MKRDLDLPSQNKPFNDLRGFGLLISTQQRLWNERALRISNENPTHGNWRQSVMKPDSRSRRYLNHPLLLSVPADAALFPPGHWITHPRSQGRLSLAFLAGTPVGSRLTER